MVNPNLASSETYLIGESSGDILCISVDPTRHGLVVLVIRGEPLGC